ncbi:DUF1501 domain-containing protein [uncultured Paraglaciecola sp.]|uniref:DUF1501 domain-containing protein n=1 Tax=uncultured Paraglaciecola sp. TaxID=1765024 RepID=UPI0026009BF2|nr:DUF1501 domain-containing protein [uncultured Paraglaciecola sp.]
MQRRAFLKSLSALPIVAYLPSLVSAQQLADQKLLILIQFGGGNDSLNMCVPYTNDAYYDARGNLAISAQETIPLTLDIGLNPVMSTLLEAWDSADLGVIQGLGYPDPNRSHFRSIEIWQTASDADEYAHLGWLNQLLPESDFPLQGVMISGSPATLSGEPNQFSLNSNDTQTLVAIPDGTAATSAVQHILNQRHIYNSAVELLNDAFEQDIVLSTEFAGDGFSQDCKLVAEVLAAGVRPHVLHLSLGSFDTHSNQRAPHDNLLEQLASGLSALRSELQALGLWQQVTIATYSEFGRRVAANGSNGTDHGTAASHLVMGGSIKGGVYGQSPSLTNLDNGDLIFTQDFRDYYRTLADWMQWSPSDEIKEFANLGFLHES